MTFSNIHVGVGGKDVAPKDLVWEAKQERPACNSKVEVKDARTLTFTWTTSADGEDAAAAAEPAAEQAPAKWGHGDDEVEA